MKILPKLILASSLILFLCPGANAQCPPASSPHIHVVQKGETLWRISKKYGKTVDEIARLNNMHHLDNLVVCQELIVNQAYFSSGDSPSGSGSALPQEGGTHIIKAGESIVDIARLYGYTEERFRRFNGLRQNESAWVGLVLKTTDCVCPSLGGEPEVVDRQSETDDQSPGTTVIPETTIRPYNPPSRPSSKPATDTFEEDPFGEEEPSMASYDWGAVPDRPTAYETKVDKVETQPGASTPTKTQTNQDQRKYLPADEQLLKKKSNQFQTATDDPSGGEGTKDASEYMKAEEINMVKEINLLRSNPAGYVKYIEDYKTKIAAGRAFGSISTCDELIKELNRTPRLSTLQPMKCIYNAAKKHGQDQRPTGDVDHVGTDGSYPWDRVRRECPSLTDGNENLVAGPSSIQDAVILLLVDEGIPNRGHRRTLLNPEWKYVACYKVGQVGNMPNNWVQKFGK